MKPTWQLINEKAPCEDGYYQFDTKLVIELMREYASQILEDQIVECAETAIDACYPGMDSFNDIREAVQSCRRIELL